MNAKTANATKRSTKSRNAAPAPTVEQGRAKHGNVAAALRAGCNTGRRQHVDALAYEAPVTIYYGPGVTTLPHTMPAEPKPPQASNVVPQRKRNDKPHKLNPFRIVGGNARSVALVERALLMVQRRLQAAAARAKAAKAADVRKARTEEAYADAVATPLSAYKVPATRRLYVGISDSRYVRSHGKAPRGTGLWLFERRTGDPVFQFNGTLSQAKKAAEAWARANGIGQSDTSGNCYTHLYICP
jgi:hypothetical protein